MSTDLHKPVAAPLKCVPRPDEWNETLLGRVARRMGVRRPWKNDLDQLRPLLPRTMQSLAPGEVRYGPDPLPKWALLGIRAQIYYCPACLSESRHIRARWRIASLTACTVHNVVLKPGLTEPAITTDYKAAGKRRIEEVTDDTSWEGAICPTPRAKEHLARVWGPFEASVVAGSPAAESAGALAWALLVERLVDAASRSIRGPDYPTDGVPAHEHRALWLERYKLTVEPNEAGVSALLKSLPLPAHRHAAIAAITYLIGDELRRKTLMSRLPLQRLKDALLAVSAAETHRACGALPRARHIEGHVSFEAAEANIGCERGLMYHLIQHGLMRGVQRIKHGRKIYVFIPEDEVRQWRRFLSNCLTQKEMLAVLNIDRRGYWLLREAGLIDPLRMSSWSRYSKASISALLSRLESVSRPAGAARAELFPLMGDWLLQSRGPRAYVATLLAEICDGQIPVYRDVSAQGLGAFKVDHVALLRLRRMCATSMEQAKREHWAAAQMDLWSCA